MGGVLLRRGQSSSDQTPARFRVAAGRVGLTVRRGMGLDEIARQFAALPPPERALFSAMVRAHDVFNGPKWREEIARRNRAIEAGTGVRVVNATEVLAAKAAEKETPNG
jgi:hypothetical protein